MMKFYCFVWAGVALLVGGPVFGQNFEEYKEKIEKKFQDYKGEQERRFKEFRDKANAEFAEYMRQAWEKYQSQPALPIPDRPKPPSPVVKEPDLKPFNVPLPFNEVITPPMPPLPPQPVVPLPEPRQPVKPSFSFLFYGTPCEVSLEEKHRFTLSGIENNHVADGWAFLSSDDFLPVIGECLEWRDKLRLCDWGYVHFVERMALEFFGEARQNEARLLQMYVLTHSGYKVRIARCKHRLGLLLPSRNNIFGYPYIAVGGEKYFITDPAFSHQSIYLYNREFPQEQFFSLQIREEPLLAENPSASRRLFSRRYPELDVTLTINRNLIDFYNDYPLSNDWDIYASASLSERTKALLYPVLQEAIAGKTKARAANMLLNFVQTAFEYRTDREQFGGERPLFSDETFYYPYCDCEDRSILYAVLVRDLLGLDVVLLYYPGHLATAVRFEEEITGDYLLVDGRRYVVCDPTYINAEIGNAMPDCATVSAKVVRIHRLPE